MNSTKFDFSKEVLQSSFPVLVDFSANWCGPCRAIAPSVEKVAEEFKGKAKVVTVDIDEDPDSAAKFGIMSIPALLVFKNGVVVDRVVGAVPHSEIRSLVQRNL